MVRTRPKAVATAIISAMGAIALQDSTIMVYTPVRATDL